MSIDPPAPQTPAAAPEIPGAAILSIYKYLPPLMGLLLVFVLFFIRTPDWKGWLQLDGTSEPTFLVFLLLSLVQIGLILFLTSPRTNLASRARSPQTAAMVPYAMSELPILLGFVAAFKYQALGNFLPFALIGIVAYAVAFARTSSARGN